MAAQKEALLSIVGKDSVFDNDEILNAYSADNSFARPVKPRLAVKAKSPADVRSIVKLANENGFPVVPVSSGPPHFRGDTVPGTAGAVIVDLSGMKNIRSIDRRNRIAIIEPGVTYGQLQPELARHGLRVSTPLLPRSSKSVVASLLEREAILTPKYQWTLMEPLRCLEVVWGDGSLMWTGEAGEYPTRDIAGQQEQHRAFVVGMGPGSVDYYRLVSAAQGTMGIVTWASVKCDILPSRHRLFFVPAPKLENLLGFAYRVLRVRLGDEVLLLNNVTFAAMLGRNAGRIKALKEQLPPWTMLIGVAGRDFLPEERVDFQQKDLADTAGQFGLEMVSALDGAGESEVLEAILKPSPEPYWKLGYKGGCQDIFFLTTLDKTPGLTGTMYAAAATMKYPASDIGVYIQPQHQGVCCHCEFSLPYDPADPGEIQELFEKASEELMSRGAFFSRPYGIWADMAYRRDAATAALLRKVKNTFDPNNVLNPGKLCFRRQTRAKEVL